MRDYQKINKLVLTKAFSKINEAFDKIKSDLYLDKEMCFPDGTSAMTFEELFLDQTGYFGKILAAMTDSTIAKPETEGSNAILITVNSTDGGTYADRRAIVLTPTANPGGEVTETVVDIESGDAGPGTTICTESIYGLEGLADYILTATDYITNVSMIGPYVGEEVVLFNCSGPGDKDCIRVNKHYGSFDMSDNAIVAISQSVDAFFKKAEVPVETPAPVPAETPAPMFHENIIRPARRNKIVEKQIKGIPVSKREIAEAEEKYEEMMRIAKADAKSGMKMLFENGQNEIYSRLIAE